MMTLFMPTLWIGVVATYLRALVFQNPATSRMPQRCTLGASFISHPWFDIVHAQFFNAITLQSVHSSINSVTQPHSQSVVSSLPRSFTGLNTYSLAIVFRPFASCHKGVLCAPNRVRRPFFFSAGICGRRSPPLSFRWFQDIDRCSRCWGETECPSGRIPINRYYGGTY